MSAALAWQEQGAQSALGKMAEQEQRGGNPVELTAKRLESFRIPKLSLKAWNKDEKGLTLIELLAVIVILAIIAAIAIPSIGGIIKNSQRNATKSNAHMIIDAARFWVTSEGVTTGSKTLKELHEGGYLENIPNDPLVKGTTYSDTASKVTIATDPNSGNLTYNITLVAADGSTTYFNNVPEASIDTTTIP
jgi:type IV pilus assembly protein PilA